MTTTEDARTWARRIVEETLVEAGLVAPSETSRAIPQDDGPPPPPSLARQAAHRIVEAVQREHEAAAASQARPAPSSLDQAAPREVDDGEAEGTDAVPAEAEVASNGLQRSEDSEAANRARRIVAEVVAAEEARRAAAEAEQAKLAAAEAEEARRAAVEAEEARRAAAEAEEARQAAAEAEEARRAAEEAEQARQAEEAAAQTAELPVAPEATAEIPTASVDLLPAEPTGPPHADQAEAATHEHRDEPTADMVLDHHEAPAPEGRLVDGPPPPPLAMIDGWWQRIRARYRRRQAMAQWAPDAARPPRRTGRWLLVTIVAVAAIALLFPMAVDALRQLVAL